MDKRAGYYIRRCDYRGLLEREAALRSRRLGPDNATIRIAWRTYFDSVGLRWTPSASGR
jgi:hypothetical protein